jgi:hypothetical protein
MVNGQSEATGKGDRADDLRHPTQVPKPSVWTD